MKIHILPLILLLHAGQSEATFVPALVRTCPSGCTPIESGRYGPTICVKNIYVRRFPQLIKYLGTEQHSSRVDQFLCSLKPNSDYEANYRRSTTQRPDTSAIIDITTRKRTIIDTTTLPSLCSYNGPCTNGDHCNTAAIVEESEKLFYCYENNDLTPISEETFKTSRKIKLKVDLCTGFVHFGKFDVDHQLRNYGIVANIFTRDIQAGIWGHGNMNRGLTFYSNMTVNCFNCRSVLNQDQTIFINPLTDEFVCTNFTRDTCYIENDNLISERFQFANGGDYNGQLNTMANPPTRKGFGEYTEITTEDDDTGYEDEYTGYWMDNMKYGVGVDKAAMSDIYIGEFFNGYKHGVGVSMSLTSEYRTVRVSKLVFNQSNGLGVFLYPDGQIFFGDFYRGKKTGAGLWVDEKLKFHIK